MKKTWKSTLFPLVAALGLSLAAAGCGSSDNSTSSPNLISNTVPTPLASPTSGVGRIYAAVANSASGLSQIQEFTGLNSTPSSAPSVVLDLLQTTGQSEPLSVRHDDNSDRLYVGCAGTSGNAVLLIYNNASQLSSATTPAATIPLGANQPFTLAYDAGRDILYIGTNQGQVARLTTASQATSATPVQFNPLNNGANLAQLDALTVNSGGDTLIATGSNNPVPNPVTSLPTFSPASTTLTSVGSLTPPGLVYAIDSRLADNLRLLVLDGGAASGNVVPFGSSAAQVFRFESANSYSGAATLTLSTPGAVCIEYNGAQDTVYVGATNGAISGYRGESTLSGSNPAVAIADVVTLQANPSGAINDIASDATR